ncbi:Rv1733c family protein [Pseudonocardia nigra]|uniref:Rv1733c family protein n=1 Tax=Pseudonocardia nigra TaxID=1921578 RepID=UPI001C5D3617|nr:hypothetical protein [Pseudonocardia nigra]
MGRRPALAVLALLVSVTAAVAAASVYRDRLEPGGPVPVPAEAVVLADAPQAYSSTDTLVPPRVPALAAWTAPDGTGRLGEVDVPGGTRAGREIAVWVDAGGAVVAQPPHASDAAAAGLVAAVGVLAAATALVAVVRAGVERSAGRRLDDEWAEVEPQWSRRARPPS